MSLTKVLFITLIAVGLTTAPAGANPEKLNKVAEELNLTPEQRAKLEKLHDTYHETLPAKKEAMMKARTALQTALRGAAGDDECRRKYEDLDRKQTDFGRARFKKVLAVRALLTTEQRAKFNAYDP